jgi:MoaA/NifB/PqqE/SkfB family radical SAM enzyme
MIEYIQKLMPRYPGYLLSQFTSKVPPHPILLNFSITNKCQSKCTTCNIWNLYDEFPEREAEELTIDEIEKTFKTIDPILVLNICGGEPTLREDLPEICRLAAVHLRPNIIHFPTNCLSPESLEKRVSGILKLIPSNIKLTVKMSLDGIGAKHDIVRGIEGNFEKVVEAEKRLIPYRDKYPNFYLDAGTTVGNDNVKDLEEISEYVKKNFRLDSFIHEIADLRGELFNRELDIRPTAKTYSTALDFLERETRENMTGKRFYSRMQQAFRLIYYERVAKAMATEKRVVKCYAGISNAHLNPWGGVWICNIQAFDKELGNLKDFDYDFNALWHSDKAKEIRAWVKEGHCWCPLVGQSYLDTMMSPIEMTRVLGIMLKGG